MARLLPNGLASLMVIGVTALAFATGAGATGTVSGPSIQLDQTTAQIGEPLGFTIDGFAARSVTVAVCGNQALRGSADCNMTSSKGLTLDLDGTSTRGRMPVAEPPVPCPCVIRVSDASNDEVAVAPLSIDAMPVAPVTYPTGADPDVLATAVDVSIDASVHPAGTLGWVRSQLGGPTRYEVTVKVKNTSTATFSGVSVAARGARSTDDDVAPMSFGGPATIRPGQTWEQTVYAVAPAPSIGSISWSAEARQAGRSVTATTITRHPPRLLLVFGLVVLADFGILGMRMLVRRHAARADGADVDPDGPPSASGHAVDHDGPATEHGVPNLAAH